jgi:hypothetical protein
VEVKVLTKCDYCGKKIGFFSVMSTWLDKDTDIAVHDKCLKKWDKKFPDRLKELERLFQIDPKTLSESDRIKILDKLIKDGLYSDRGRVKKIPKDREIKFLEKMIEDFNTDEYYPNKENILKQLNENLKQLKNEDID